jgi:hypothetical protein
VKGKKVKGYMKGGDINDSLPGIEGLDAKFGQSVADANKAAGAATAKRMKKAKDSEAESMKGRNLTAKEKKAKKRAEDNKKLDAKAKKMMGAPKTNNTTPAPMPKPPMAGAGAGAGAGAAKAAMMGGAAGGSMGNPRTRMGGMPPMGNVPPAQKPPMPMMNKGGKVKKGGSCGGYKKGGKVRGAGIAKQGVRACKMR